MDHSTTHSQNRITSLDSSNILSSPLFGGGVVALILAVLAAIAFTGPVRLDDRVDLAVKNVLSSEALTKCGLVDRPQTCKVGELDILDVGNSQNRVLLVAKGELVVASVLAGALHLDSKLTDADAHRVKYQFAETFAPR